MGEPIPPEALIPRFKLGKVLNQVSIDQNGRRIILLGEIENSPTLFIAERAAFPSGISEIKALHASLVNITNLGDNDIYRWYLASLAGQANADFPDLKATLIYPCTPAHVKKYSPQGFRMVTETPAIFKNHVRPYMKKKRDEGRLNWVFNILEGREEQESVLLREPGQGTNPDDGFLLLPDLNWDRRTLTSLRLLALPERRDIWSVRDLKKGHVEWLRHMRDKIILATVKLYDGVDSDMLKLYFHYQPTYYHLHIHVVHTMTEANSTQAIGKALGLENIISQLETISGGPDAGMADVDLTYSLGEASELWTEIFFPLKTGEKKL